MSAAEKILLVDGHSAIFAIPEFAGLHRGPDTVIERLAARFGSKDQVRVASNDRMVLTTVMAFGAEGMGIGGLVEMIGHGR